MGSSTGCREVLLNTEFGGSKAAEVQVEDEAGIVFRFAGPGETLGSPGCLELVDTSPEVLRAVPGQDFGFNC